MHYRIDGKVKVLKPGMFRAEVDKLLGEPKVLRTRADSLYQYGEDGDIFVSFKNDRVAYIDPGAASLNAQIKYGIQWKQVVARMGEPTAISGSDRIFMYKMDRDGSMRKLTRPNQLKYAVGQANVFSVRTTVNPYDIVVGIAVWQESFRVEMENRRQSLQELRPDVPHDWRLTMDELALVDEQGRIVVSLGMDKAEVGRNLGECELVAFTDMLPRCDYEGVKVFYREDVAVGIVISEASSNIYTTPAGIGLLSTVQHIVSLYGEPFAYDGTFLTFILEPSGDKLVPVVKEDRAPKSTGRYVLSFLVEGDDPGLITYMMIADEVMAYTMK